MWLCRMLVSMVMVMDVERKRNSRVHVVVREMVLHRGKPQGVAEEVMVLVVVMGPKQQERHRHDPRGCRPREQVRACRRLSLPTRYRPCRMSPTLRILQLSKVVFQMSE